MKRERIKRHLVVGFALAGVALAEYWADPGGRASSIDRIFTWAFVAFVVGLLELFLLFVALAILGDIDLPKVFQDKDGQLSVNRNEAGEPLFVRAVAGKGAVSLSRLQAFLWTLVIMVIYFHKAVVDGHGELPTIPSELLLVMGISGAVYLASKDIASRDLNSITVPGAEAGASITADADAKAQADAAAKAQAEAEARAQSEAAKAQADAEARSQAEANARADADTQAKADAQAKAQADAEASAKAEADAKVRADTAAASDADTGVKPRPAGTGKLDDGAVAPAGGPL